MSTETAARYLSLDSGTLYDVASRGNIAPVAVHLDVERWRKSDLDALISRLPKKAPAGSSVKRRVIALDTESVAQIVAGLINSQTLRERPSAPPLVSIKAAGQMLGLSRTTLHRMIVSGQLQPCRIGSRTLIPETEIQRLLHG